MNEMTSSTCIERQHTAYGGEVYTGFGGETSGKETAWEIKA